MGRMKGGSADRDQPAKPDSRPLISLFLRMKLDLAALDQVDVIITRVRTCSYTDEQAVIISVPEKGSTCLSDSTPRTRSPVPALQE
jgi:hypothetical protein